MKILLSILLCLTLTSCSRTGLYTQAEMDTITNNLTDQMDALYDERDSVGSKIKMYEVASRIQTWYANQGINRPMSLIYETTRQAYDISPNFPPPKGLTAETFTFYLITFASIETDFNPLVQGKKGDSGIAQTLLKDYPRLIRKAKKRGLKFKDDIRSIRTGLICCAEEYNEKLILSKGDLYEAVVRYNGARPYAKRFFRRYEVMRYGE